MKSISSQFLASAALLALSGLSLVAEDDPVHSGALAIHEKYQEAIITVKAVIDIEVVVGGSANQSQEQRLEVPGTVIDATGLTVVSNATIDVGKQIESQIARQVRGRQVDVKTTFKEVNLLLPDGTEISARVVMKDDDLDVAFVLPDAAEVEAEGVEFVAVSFPDETPKVTLLEPIVILNRLGKDLDRTLSLYVTKVEALIKKPRPFVLTHNTSTGTPAFLPSGEPIGLFVRRIVDGNATSTVVLPSKEVARLAREAAAAEPEEIDPAEEDEEEEESAEPDAETLEVENLSEPEAL